MLKIGTNESGLKLKSGLDDDVLFSLGEIGIILDSKVDGGVTISIEMDKQSPYSMFHTVMNIKRDLDHSYNTFYYLFIIIYLFIYYSLIYLLFIQL